MNNKYIISLVVALVATTAIRATVQKFNNYDACKNYYVSQGASNAVVADKCAGLSSEMGVFNVTYDPNLVKSR